MRRRAGGNVGDEHAILDGTTLPPSDPFWSRYLPPNGWGCRCTAVQVRRGKYPQSDPAISMERGNRCTAAPKQQIFRFNPGKDLKIFPPKHPYLPKGCGECELKKRIRLATPVDKMLPQCRACGEIFKLCLANSKKRINQWRDENLPSMSSVLDIENTTLCSGSLLLTRGSIRNTMGHTLNLSVRNTLPDTPNQVKNWKYVGWLKCKEDPATGKPKHPEAEYFLYYEMKIGGKTYYANVKANKDLKREELYCIRDRLNLAKINNGVPPNIADYKKK